MFGAEADDRLVVGPPHVGEAAALDRDDALARHRAVAARELLGDVSCRPRRRRASMPLVREREVARADARPVLDRRVAVLDRERDRAGGAALATTAGASPPAAPAILMPMRANERYIQPSQPLRLGEPDHERASADRCRCLYSSVTSLAERAEARRVRDRHLAGALHHDRLEVLACRRSRRSPGGRTRGSGRSSPTRCATAASPAGPIARHADLALAAEALAQRVERLGHLLAPQLAGGLERAPRRRAPRARVGSRGAAASPPARRSRRRAGGSRRCRPSCESAHVAGQRRLADDLDAARERRASRR